MMIGWIERHYAAHATRAGPAHLSSDLHRAAELFDTGFQVQCMKIIMISAIAGILGPVHHVDDSRNRIDYGRASNTDLWADVVVRTIPGIGVASNNADILTGHRRPQVHLP